MKKRSLFVGALPGPINGFTYMNYILCQRLNGDNDTKLFIINTLLNIKKLSTQSVIWKILRFFYQPIIFFRVLMLSLIYRPNAIYHGINGGKAQIYDIVIIVLIFLFPRKFEYLIFHHTFKYFSEPTILSRLLFKVCFKKGVVHVVLCSKMGQILQERYKVSHDKITELSNLSLLKFTPREQASETVTSIGFIGNISKGKGVFEFLEVLEHLKLNSDIKGKLAGPIQCSQIQSVVDEKLSFMPNLEYLGSIYGNEKDQFFRDIDVLLFPSTLEEAEPVTIWEAYSYSLPVIAIDKGCIGEIVSEIGGCVISSKSEFVPQALIYLTKLKDPEYYSREKNKIYMNFKRKVKENENLTLMF